MTKHLNVQDKFPNGAERKYTSVTGMGLGLPLLVLHKLILGVIIRIQALRN